MLLSLTAKKPILPKCKDTAPSTCLQAAPIHAIHTLLRQEGPVPGAAWVTEHRHKRLSILTPEAPPDPGEFGSKPGTTSTYMW